MKLKDRILIFQDMSFEFFGIANAIKKQYDCELFGLFDLTEKQSQFFKKQKIVHFEKKWFLHNHILKKNTPADIEYLSKFERDTGIELWKLIENDRIFFNYNNFYKFSTNEILLIVEQILKLYDYVLENCNPDFLITSVTYNLHIRLLYELCKIKNITILMLVPLPLKGRYVISQSNTQIDNYNNEITKIPKLKNLNELEINLENSNDISNQNKKTIEGYQNSKFFALNAGIKYLFSSNSHTKNNYTYYGRKKINVFYYTLKMKILKKVRYDFLKKHSIKNIQDNKFILFPLITDPEFTLLIDSPFFTNILELIKNISKSIPIDHKLYVKEHPTMNLRDWRPISFYKQLLALPNVKLLSPDFNINDLLKKMSLIITYSSTMGFQASYYDKNSILVSDSIYSYLESVQTIENLNDLPHLIKKTIDKKFDKNNFMQFLKLLENISFETNGELQNFTLDFLNNFLYSGYLADVILNESKIEIFLKNYDSLFIPLSNEFIKKIIDYKTHNKLNI